MTLLGNQPEANFLVTQGTNPTFPFTDSALSGAPNASGINTGDPAAGLPGNPNSQTTTAANSATFYDPAFDTTSAAGATKNDVDLEVWVYGYINNGTTAGDLTIADHRNNQQATYKAVPASTAVTLPRPYKLNKGIRATSSIATAIFQVFYSIHRRTKRPYPTN